VSLRPRNTARPPRSSARPLAAEVGSISGAAVGAIEAAVAITTFASVLTTDESIFTLCAAVDYHAGESGGVCNRRQLNNSMGTGSMFKRFRNCVTIVTILLSMTVTVALSHAQGSSVDQAAVTQPATGPGNSGAVQTLCGFTQFPRVDRSE
jgi:hypothetical protein